MSSNMALAVKLAAIQSLACVARTALPLGMNSISVDKDGLLAIASAPRPARLKFFAENLQFNVAMSPETEHEGSGEVICQIWAECGYVPYTVESSWRRQSVRTVLSGSRGLSHARFVVENGQKILLISECRLPSPVTPECVVYEILQLIQEARPYLRLLAEAMSG